MSRKKLKRIKLRSLMDSKNIDLSAESTESSSGVNFKKIWISIIQKSSLNQDNSNTNYSNNHNSNNYLKPFISFYQSHKHVDSDRLTNYKLTQQKYPFKISSYYSSSSSSLLQSPEPIYGLDAIESTTSSYISFTNNLPPLSSLPTSHYDEYHNQHKTNEFYSIFVSVITAAVFLFFIMWRWFKMNSDFRKALREQFEIQQHVRNNSNNNNNNTTVNNSNNMSTNVQQQLPICARGSTRMALLPINHWNYNNSFTLPNTREELQATASNLIAQLSNGEYRSARQHQQMIDRARYCLQQLKLHARLTQFQRQQQQQRRSNYSTFNSTSNRSNLVSDYSTSSSLSPLSLSEHSSTNSLCQQQQHHQHAHDMLPPVPPVSITSLQTLTSFQTNESYLNQNNFLANVNRARNSSVYNFNHLNSTNTPRLINCNNNNNNNNEPPPDYESLMIKSCSLPSYSNLKSNHTTTNYNNNNNNNEKLNEKKQEK